eukprot:jgi/Mesvir1/16697/Mv15093-RA.2
MESLWWNRLEFCRLRRCLFASLLLLLVAVSVVSDPSGSCPCQECPCFCPCVDRTALVIAFVQPYDVRNPSNAAYQLSAGARQAAADRGLQLEQLRIVQTQRLYVEEARAFLWRAARGSRVNAIVTTLHDETYLEPLLAAHAADIPVYIVGGAPAGLMAQLQRRAAEARQAKGAAALATLASIGVEEDHVISDLVVRLVAMGVERVDCFVTGDGNVAFADRCRMLKQRLAAAGRAGFTHLISEEITVILAAMQLVEEVIADDPSLSLATTNGTANTALVVMDTVVYSIVREVQLQQHVLPYGRVIVFGSSVEILADVHAGAPVLVVEQHYFSQAYAAVALAGYELQTGRIIPPSGVKTRAAFLSGQEFQDADLAREVCREQGYPVCGDSAFGDVTGGCACFNRTDVKIKALGTLPSILELHMDMAQGFSDGIRDFHGTVFDGPRMSEVTSGLSALVAAESVMVQNNWTALLNFDYFLALLDPAVATAMARLGASKGNRSYWLGGARDVGVPIQEYLDLYLANGYIGPGAESWQALGWYARQQLEARGGGNLLMFVPLTYLSVWFQMAQGFVEGFFNNSLPFPPGFWNFPPKGSVEKGTGVWSLLHDNWPQPGSLNMSAGGVAGRRPVTLQIQPAPAHYDLRTTFVQKLRVLLSAPSMPVYETIVILPFVSEDVALTLALLEDVNVTRGHDTQLMSLYCRSSDYQALAYPDTLPGGHRHAACMDWQLDLMAYLAFMVPTLQQHTGEALFHGEVLTGRLVTRDVSPASWRRMADCELYRLKGFRDLRSDALFSVCDYDAHCGGVEEPCSGRGTCAFPTAETFLALESSPVGQLPWEGSCDCDRSAAGHLCERMSTDTRRLRRWLPVGVGLFLVLGGSASYLVYMLLVPSEAKKRQRMLAAKKRRPPLDGEPVAAVFTDIEGSTALWEWDPELMNHCLQIHHKVIRCLLPKHNGYESSTEGDAFEVVFHDSTDALRWALDVQTALLHPEALLNDPAHPQAANSWPEKLFQHPMGTVTRSPAGAVLFRGLRVRMGIHAGTPEATYKHPNGRRRYYGAIMDIAKAIGDAPVGGGQVLMSLDAWADLGIGTAVTDLSVVVHNIGEYCLHGDLPPMQLMEVLTPALHARAPFPPIRCKEQLSPSFFEAPAASSYITGPPPSDPIITMFTFVGGRVGLKGSPALAQSIQLLTDFVRARLLAHNGYECEENDGDFLLAFSNPWDAALFSQDVQGGAMDLPWPSALLEEEAAAEIILMPSALNVSRHSQVSTETQVEMAERLVCRGLRVKIGLYMGVPTRCRPHACTGRAAYFGPLMNRSARIATTAADGQTLCNAELVKACRESSTRQDLAFTSLGQFSLKVRHGGIGLRMRCLGSGVRGGRVGGVGAGANDVPHASVVGATRVLYACAVSAVLLSSKSKSIESHKLPSFYGDLWLHEG